MLVTLGARRDAGDAVDLLLECHGRIRLHLAMARRLAGGVIHPTDEIRATAAQVRRYFTEALPLHILDEEEAVTGLLAGRTDVIDRALAQMTIDHLDHEPRIERLVDVCDLLERHPDQLARHAGRLGALAADLERDLLAHLELEERVLFPALRALPPEHREVLRAAMRNRRARFT